MQFLFDIALLIGTYVQGKFLVFLILGFLPIVLGDCILVVVLIRIILVFNDWALVESTVFGLGEYSMGLIYTCDTVVHTLPIIVRLVILLFGLWTISRVITQYFVYEEVPVQDSTEQYEYIQQKNQKTSEYYDHLKSKFKNSNIKTKIYDLLQKISLSPNAKEHIRENNLASQKYRNNINTKIGYSLPIEKIYFEGVENKQKETDNVEEALTELLTDSAFEIGYKIAKDFYTHFSQPRKSDEASYTKFRYVLQTGPVLKLIAWWFFAPCIPFLFYICLFNPLIEYPTGLNAWQAAIFFFVCLIVFQIPLAIGLITSPREAIILDYEILKSGETLYHHHRNGHMKKHCKSSEEFTVLGRSYLLPHYNKKVVPSSWRIDNDIPLAGLAHLSRTNHRTVDCQVV